MTDMNTVELRDIIKEELTRFFDNSIHENDDKLLSREAAAETLGVQPNTLAVWAMKGTGPAPTKIGTRSMYRRSVLDAYISKNTMPR
jgi:hypothetical protein